MAQAGPSRRGATAPWTGDTSHHNAPALDTLPMLGDQLGDASDRLASQLYAAFDLQLICSKDKHQVTISTFAGFGDQAAAAAQAEVTARISSVVGWAGTAAENRAAMRVRRSLISMSSKAGPVLSPYHGWSSRRASMSAWS